MYDVTCTNHGSIVTVAPETDAAREWLEDRTAEPQTWWCGTLVVEPRYIVTLLLGMREEGFSVPLEEKT